MLENIIDQQYTYFPVLVLSGLAAAMMLRLKVEPKDQVIIAAGVERWS